jgi:hypothetical protein
MSNKIDIDFSVQSNPYYLKVCDLSNWGLIVNDPAIIDITLPGYTDCVTKYFDKGKVNIFNSILLEVNCCDGSPDAENVTLPDGIYTIKVTGSPSTYSKTYKYLKTDLFDMEVDRIYIDNLNSRNRTDLIKTLTQIEFLVKSAGAHLRWDDIEMAGMLFQQAQDMVEDLKNCKTCK